MGVTGLWRLIEPAGKPVPVETLENKILAVDISIWLHQMVKGYQDAKGAPVANAHLIGLFQRLCKLLYFRIKPVFVFDGAFPELKKETIAKRQDHKAKYNSESERIKRELALLLSKKTAVNSLLGKKISPKKSGQSSADPDDLFKLPALPQREEESESESDDEQNTSGSSIDLHTLDIESDTFKKLDVKEKYDLLIELKETRKMSSWGRLHELPKKSDTFSDFQMQRLLKRRKVQECLEETEKEMGDTGMSLNDLESLLNEEGIDTKIDTLPTRRIASNVSTRYLLIKDVKQALAEAKKRKELENKPSTSKIEEVTEIKEEKPVKVDELEDDLQKAIQMSLECVDDTTDHNNSNISKTDDSWTSCMTDSDYASSESEQDDGFEPPDMSCAKSYIMQYTDFTHRAIDKIVTDRNKHKYKQKYPKVDEILEDINKEKSVVIDNVDLSSDDEDDINKLKSQHEPFSDSQKAKTNFDSTQSSVVYIENQTQEIISLDSTIEESVVAEEESERVQIKEENYSSDEVEDVINTETVEDSESSDTDFEEVPDSCNANKPIVELTLNMGEEPDNDIFADIFEENNVKTSESIIPVKDKTDNEKNNVDEPLFKIPNVPPNKSIVTIGIIKENKDKLETQNKPDTVVETNVKNVDMSLTISKKSGVTIKSPKESTSTITKAILDNFPHTDEQNKQHVEMEVAKPIQKPSSDTLSREKLNTLVNEMETAEQDLLQEKGRLDRVGRNITEQMTKEAQELLQIFGIPYIVAPMEAEAQCAFLENVKLTDGTITDDSDIWLFGGKTVYKNFFNQKKHVLQFLAERIEKSFNLSREQLVLLALLVGSDYTTGVTGVGPVTALEILASFPFNKKQINESTKQERFTAMVKGLQEFKQWVRAGKRTDNISLKKKLKNIDLTDDFPSVRVVQAYLEPNIEKSEDKFSWGELDITILRDYTKAKFGWNQHKLDEIIKPVIKRLQDRKTQRSVQDFFKRKVDFQSLDEQMSKRVKAAVQRMGPELPVVEAENSQDTAPTVKRKNTKTSSSNTSKAGPSTVKRKKTETSILINQGVKVVSHVKDGKSEFEIQIPKSDRFQEIIPQREKDKQSLLENKMKAIELFRKTHLDKKRKPVKRKALQPKEKAELSESDSD